MRVFVSVPMNGRKDKDVRNDIDNIISKIPDAELIDQMLPDTGNRIDMLGRSIRLMANADLVVFAKGWDHSKGCIVEKFICDTYDIKYTYEVILKNNSR